MAEITINGVKYTNVPNKKAGTKFAASLTQSNIGASQAVQDYVNSAYFYPLVNAIDINWNGVEVEENSYINTTSDLISYIASKESNIDLSSYATMAYVDQKITDLIGGAPETLDTLKELADALADDASLAYVTQALDGKADKSSLTNYATNSYVTTELDKKANKSDIVQADMCETDTTSKSYVLNNPYQYHVKSLYGTNYNCYNLVIPHNAKQQGFSNLTNGALIIGDNHYISATYGIVQGQGNKINTMCEVAFGKYNVCDTSSNNTIFTVGNGTASKKHNAFAIRKNGTIYIADTEDGTPYSLQSSLNSKANANDVYTKTEVDNMIPESADLSNYVSYTAANSYYMTVEGPKQIINSVKTFVGNKLINFRQSTLSDKLGFTLYNNDEKELGGFEWRPNTIGTKGLLSLQQYLGTGTKYTDVEMGYLGFRLTEVSSKYNLITPLPSYVNTIETINVGSDYRNFFFPLVFQNGSNKVYTDCTGLVDMASLMPDLNDYATNSYVTTELDKKADKTELPDMSNYVSVSSYNALLARVEELAGWIVSYHSTPEPEPTYDFHFDEQYIDISIGDTVTPTITNTYPYTNISYTSDDSSIVSVDANGTCTALTLGQATISATLYDNDNNEQAFASVQLNVNKFVPVAYWSFNGTALPNEKMVVLPYDTLTQSTYTFYSDPATGWSVGDTLYETPGITIDNSTYAITVDPTSFEHTGKGRVQVEYNEDATYQQGGYSIEFKILAQGADPQFFFADDDVTMSQNSTQAEVQLYDLTGLTEQGYTPTFTIGNPSYVSVAPRQDAPNWIEFTWLAEGETTVTATITDGNETHSATITVHCQWDRDWVDGHVYTSQNNEVNYEYGIVQSGSNPSLTFTASNGNTQDPMNGDLFEVSISNDTNNVISYTSTSSGLTISFDNNALASASAGDEINMTIIKQQDTTYNYYTKDLRFKVVHNGNDPLLWWNNDTFTVTENDVFSQDPITNWLGNQIIDFSTWQPLTPTISFDPEPGNIAHVDQNNVLHGDNEGYVQMHATVTDLNNNTHTATATVHVEAAS